MIMMTVDELEVEAAATEPPLAASAAAPQQATRSLPSHHCANLRVNEPLRHCTTTLYYVCTYVVPPVRILPPVFTLPKRQDKGPSLDSKTLCGESLRRQLGA